MFDSKFMEVVGKEGVVAIVTNADNEAHVVNTWNSYLVFPDDQRILIPAWKMLNTEKKVAKNSSMLMTLAQRKWKGVWGRVRAT
jgi:hypothetical protein